MQVNIIILSLILELFPRQNYIFEIGHYLEIVLLVYQEFVFLFFLITQQLLQH